MTGWEVGLRNAVRFAARHWLAAWLLALVAFVGLPYIAPLLAWMGFNELAGWLYVLYRPTCHQLPSHSWFMFGPQAHYEWSAIQPYTGVPIDSELMSYHHPVTHPDVGYQAAVCQRDTAIWLSLLAGSFAFALVRQTRDDWISPLPFRAYLIAMVPIGIDGLTALFGLRDSTPTLRTLTGALFGLATAWFVLPQLDAAFRDVAAEEADGDEQGGGGFGRPVSQGP